MSDKVLNLVGLAHRAGKTVCGAQAAEQQIKKNGAALLFLASDSGPTNEERYVRFGARKHIDMIRTYSKEQLGLALGHSQTAVIVVTDKGFAEAMIKAVQEME